MSDVIAEATAPEQTGSPADAIAAMIAANRRNNPQPNGSTPPPAGQETKVSPEATPEEGVEPEGSFTEAEETAHHGVSFGAPKIDLDHLRNWKANDVVAKLTGGLAQMAKQRQVTTVQGVGKFTSPNQIAVTAADGRDAGLPAGADHPRPPFCLSPARRIC